jgi:cysteine desulfurase/selenocysteine lyase
VHKSPSIAESGFDLERIRNDFPILHAQIRGKRLAYLDNAATTQKPNVVLDVMDRYYRLENSNVHRGVHYLSEVATERYEAARSIVRRFLNARREREIVFVRSTTEGINLIASSFGRSAIREGDEILLSGMEHHSNIVPWQMLCQAVGARLRIIPMTDEGELRLQDFEKLMTERTKLVALVHVSNALGTVNPVHEIISMAHRRNIPVLLDGAQAVAHMAVDVQELDCDFYVFSGHKVFGPTGIGVVYGKEQFLEAMPPYQGGGDMIKSVTFEKTTYNDLPYKFEAGTPNIAGAIGLGAALEYVSSLGFEIIGAYENDLLTYATDALLSVKDVKLIGTPRQRAGVISFVMEGIHPHDIGTIVDQEGVAIRTGHHCAQPVMERFGVAATARASLAFYNTREDIDALVNALFKVHEVFH